MPIKFYNNSYLLANYVKQNFEAGYRPDNMWHNNYDFIDKYLIWFDFYLILFDLFLKILILFLFIFNNFSQSTLFVSRKKTSVT